MTPRQSYSPLNWLLPLILLTCPTSAFLRLSPSLRPLSLLLQAATSSSANIFPTTSEPPYLAVITEPDACDNDDRLTQTLTVLKQIDVDLISVRVNANSHPPRVVRLIKQLVAIDSNTRIVVSSDWVEEAIQGRAHGIHVKESHRPQIPSIRQQFADAGLPPPLIGTSAHSIESALEAAMNDDPDYLFVGTCYVTQTHPEKSVSDLEGPKLPGQVAQALHHKNRIPVLAIGGIDETNCAEPIELGASGVATIRAILQARDPNETVIRMQQAMEMAYQESNECR